MACKRCGSKNQQQFAGELSASFSGIENINERPVYVSQRNFYLSGLWAYRTDGSCNRIKAAPEKRGSIQFPGPPPPR